MADLQLLIAESRPMLEEFLSQIGIHQPGQPIVDARLLASFSDWITAQEIADDDFAYLVSRAGAFICEYLIDGHSAVRNINGNRIVLRLPIDVSLGVYREFDPYAVAVGLVRERRSLKDFLDILCS